MPSFTMKTGLVTLLATAAPLASAHMELTFPPPLKSKHNPAAGQDIDYSMTAPLSGDGSNYPCKGYLSLVGTAAGAPSAKFAQGGSYKFTVEGGAAHGGGSCQASLSYDGGKTFTVIKSIVGNCPIQPTGDFPFTIPPDAPTGDAIFSWSWLNQIGNREFYQNCAVVTITGAGSAKRGSDSLVKVPREAAYAGRPSIFLANLGNGCSTLEGKDVDFPDPGPDEDKTSTKTAAPQGNCGAVKAGGATAGSSSGGSSGSGSSSGGSSGSGSSSGATTSAAAPAATTSASGSSLPGGVFVTVPAGNGGAASSTAAAAPAASSSSAAPSSGTGSGSGSGSGTGSGSGGVKPSATASAAAPAGSGTSSGGSGSGSGSSSGGSTTTTGAYAPGTACTNEGAWNCLGGTAFQRCASGSWSAVISMASGTSCKAGVSDTLWKTRRGMRPTRASVRRAAEAAAAAVAGVQ